MKASAGLLPADQARQLGLAVGDTIEGREEFSPERWHEVRLTLLWLGQRQAVWLQQWRDWRQQGWSLPDEAAGWTLDVRDWRRVDTPPEVAALLPQAPDTEATRAATLAAMRAADAAISDEALAAEYRAWWGQSWGVPPNNQAIATAVAWGRHLLNLALRRREVQP